MTTYCDKCGISIDVTNIYCPFCSNELPQRTIGINVKKESLKQFWFCPFCSEKNIRDAQFCCVCGAYFFKQLTNAILFCPGCGRKSSSGSNFCFNCKFSFADWFAIKGIIAD